MHQTIVLLYTDIFGYMIMIVVVIFMAAALMHFGSPAVQRSIYFKRSRGLGVHYREIYNHMEFIYNNNKGQLVRIPLNDAIPETFYIIAQPYKKHDDYDKIFTWATDGTKIYFNDKILPAEIESFSIIGNGYSKDRKHVYYRDKPVKHADMPSFKVVFPPGSYDATDKNHKYLYGKIVNV